MQEPVIFFLRFVILFWVSLLEKLSKDDLNARHSEKTMIWLVEWEKYRVSRAERTFVEFYTFNSTALLSVHL